MRVVPVLLGLAALIVGAGCGGGGGSGFAGTTPTLSLGSSLLPQLTSGEALAGDGYALPIQGGCGGPYTIRLIGGDLPEGISIDDRQANIEGPGVPAVDRHHLVGTALEDGSFAFRLEILDRGCRPAVSMTADFTWSVGQGSVVIVDSDPPSIPAALYNDPFKYSDVDALDKTVYGDFTSVTFVVAGGVGPYTCAIIDDPADPDDDNGLPFGVVMPPASCSLVGSPQQVGDGGKPFRFTVMATDSVGQTTVRKFQWKIDTPPMIVGSADITDGTAGVSYGDALQIVDGVPPFKFELTADLPTDLDNTSSAWVYSPPSAPTFPSITNFTVAPTGGASNKLSAASYPAPAALGPYYPAPPEGIYLIEDGGQAGSITGVPRRFGSFTINVHAYSATVPNERGQHAFAQFAFDIDAGVPLLMVDSFLVDGNGSNTFLANTPDGVGTLPEFEVQQPRTTQMIATGGAPFDGYTDAPHASQRMLDLGEVAGTYAWSVSDWDPRGIGWHPANSPAGRPTGINANITGAIFTTNGGLDLQRQGRQVIEVTVSDQRLPVAGVDVHEMALSVGPDVLIIAESRQSSTTTSGSNAADSTPHGDSMFIKKMQIVNNVAQRSPLDGGDMVATHIVPAIANLNALSNPLGRLISGVGKATYTGTGRDAGASDLLRVNVNSTGWWNDSWQLNPKAARSFMHGDATKPSYEYYASEYYNYSACPETTAVALPDITDGSVTHAPGAGVYTDGGKLYMFENDTHFGVFIIRDDARIYVPFAMQKGTWQGFGDYCQSPLNGTGAGASSSSHMRLAHMAVSPNGRFAAFKIMSSPTYPYENTGTSRTVLIDLAGDKSLGGDTYRIVGTSYSAGYLMADALTLTNEYLYLLVQRTTLDYENGWLQHNIYREPILGGTGTAQFAPGLPSNGISSYLSLPYHNITTSYFVSSYNGSTVYYNYYFYMGGSATNRTENDSAPIPFRVSADGSSCLLAAGPYNGATSGSSVHEFYAWVDKNGQGFRLASTTDRKMPYGGSQAHQARWGAAYYGYAGHQQWGKYEGPSGNLEISDDGNRIAYGYSEVGSWSGTYYSSYRTYYNSSWRDTRMNVMSATTSDDWASFSETAITAPYFGGSHVWRFGGLAFSRDGNRLFFFGGISQLEAQGTSDYAYYTTSNYRCSAYVTGTYYLFDFANASQVRSLLSSSDGGSGSNTYTSSSPFNPTSAARSTAWGLIAPRGGFWSANGDFLYICTEHPFSSTDPTCFRLVGINTTTATVNSRAANTGFAIGNWPSRYGFLTGATNIFGYYGAMISYNGPYGVQSLARVKMAEDTGVVFFGSHGQRYTYAANTSYASVYTIAYASSYALDAGHIECFSSDVGGDLQRLTPFSGDGSITSARGRNLQFIEVNDAGDRLIFHYNTGNTGGTTEYLNNLGKEGVGYISGIQLNPTTGALVSRTFALLEGTTGSQAGKVGSSQGRAGGSVAFGTDGQRVYYSFGPNASDENQRTIVAPRIDGDGNVDGSTTTRFGSGSRDAILHASR